MVGRGSFINTLRTVLLVTVAAVIAAISGASWAADTTPEALDLSAIRLELHRPQADEGMSVFNVYMLQEERQLFSQKVHASMQLQYISYYPAVFFQAIGGNGAGWGLYRYDIERNKLTFWNADAREISIDSNTGVITVNYVRHTPNGMGYLDDKVKFYHWPNNADQPVEFQP